MPGRGDVPAARDPLTVARRRAAAARAITRELVLASSFCADRAGALGYRLADVALAAADAEEDDAAPGA